MDKFRKLLLIISFSLKIYICFKLMQSTVSENIIDTIKKRKQNYTI